MTTMLNFTDIMAALTAIERYLIQHAQDLDQIAQVALLRATLSPSPVDKIVTTAETIYALGTAADAGAKALAAGLIEFAARYGWHGLGRDPRALGMVLALRRDMGEDAPLGGWPAPSNDPAARADLVAALVLTTASSDPTQA